MADPFEGAEGAIDAQRRALLAAVAQQGSAAQAQHSQQSEVAGKVREMGLQGAAQRANVIGAPAEQVANLQSSAGSVGDLYARDAEAASQAHGREMARMSGANSDYFRQIEGALPIARQVAQARIAEVEAQKEAERQRMAMDQEDRQFAREQREFEREKLALERDKLRGAQSGKTSANPAKSPEQAAQELGLNFKKIYDLDPEYFGNATNFVFQTLSEGGTQADALAALNSYAASTGRPLTSGATRIIARMYGLGSAPTSAGVYPAPGQPFGPDWQG